MYEFVFVIAAYLGFCFRPTPIKPRFRHRHSKVRLSRYGSQKICSLDSDFIAISLRFVPDGLCLRRDLVTPQHLSERFGLINADVGVRKTDKRQKISRYDSPAIQLSPHLTPPPHFVSLNSTYYH